jgi:hypothetical protein
MELFIGFEDVDDNCRMKIMEFIVDCSRFLKKGLVVLSAEMKIKKNPLSYSFKVIFPEPEKEWESVVGLFKKLLVIKKEAYSRKK